ncbi:Guanine nucleotide-exchange protein [Musa troglodytarum]|uniref:Guanine nucleotide-exchange protein n=1 Tax=Musa troglodytarum TaxID=320322 RepID=A0A9E7HFI0_9LILI|nr:Guanine nucleotide-exchange protein [Musa troglodytarum]
MASAEADSRVALLLVPALEKIVKNASWRKGHSKLAHQCKSLIDRLSHPPSSPRPSSPNSSSSLPGPLRDGGAAVYSLADSETYLAPLVAACTSGSPRVAEPAIDCVQKLIAHSYLYGEADPSSGPDSRLLAQLVEAVCGCYALGGAEDSLELLVLKTLLSAVTSTALRIHGDSLLQIVRTCYDLYLSSKNPVNQATAKASLIQMLVIVFRRMEADSSTVPVQPIVVAELMEPADRSAAVAAADVNFVQGFITKIISDIDGVLNPSTLSPGLRPLANTTARLCPPRWRTPILRTCWIRRTRICWTPRRVDRDDDTEVQIGNKLKRDAFLVFRALCKLSMKTLPKEAVADPAHMKGKIVALELLKILLENAGAVFRTSERFLGAIKQYLCLSLLKNSASAHLIVFQLSCSIFMSLVSRFRPGLKAEIGVFFPMIVLRVLENVAQPNFQQKMIVLCFFEKLCVDSQILVDIFINYDCDIHSSNIFERMVNGLLKTAQGPPPGVPTTLIPPQDTTMKFEAMKCLVAILRSMGDWMNKQLRIPDPHSQKTETIDGSGGSNELTFANGNGDETVEVSDSNSDTPNGTSEVASIEQRRAYKLELQEGISLFNQKPKKGIEFLINTKKVGDVPADIAAFLRSASGLNKTLIGFRLPGEAQKIDRIMEKFAERYCKCNPKAFTSADTAYVLAYSVILLNTDAHNPMVKNKMSPDDFIRNNRGIDDGKDLSEEYLRSLFDRISKNEIKMKEDTLALQQIQSSNSNRILGLDSILNIVIRKRDSSTETSDDMIRHMQEQFKEKAHKSESIYYSATDVVILKFMIEVCWAPMLAAFSVPVDQSDDETVISLCLEGFRSAVHVTAVMSMKTQRDAFVTSLAKFTSLHSAADIKQRNIDAIKVCVDLICNFTHYGEDGNYLQEAWEHILTCVSRFEHLHLLGEGAPPDATFFTIQQTEIDKSKQAKSSILPALKKKGPSSIVARRGTYDSAGVGGHASGAVTSEQMNNLISNLNLLEQVGIAEVNRVFIRSEKLNSEAIIDFVKALCKVSMEELRSTSDPRVFSLTKIVEITHYNMDRIRLVWSSIWNVLSEFFVTIGCSENLSIAIFAMDSLRQLSMKFLERKELNYNFQNEFMKPFVIVMRKSRAVEIRELIIRCVSQMVLARVSNVKSGWKSMFMVFATASYDDHKNIVLLAFEVIEKILRDYFPYITETETTTFTDCVNCLVAFTNSRFNKDISLNAIAFLRFCAAKLAEGDIGASARFKDKEASGSIGPPSPHIIKDEKQDPPLIINKDDHLHLWFPLLAGETDSFCLF